MIILSYYFICHFLRGEFCIMNINNRNIKYKIPDILCDRLSYGQGERSDKLIFTLTVLTF